MYGRKVNAYSSAEKVCAEDEGEKAFTFKMKFVESYEAYQMKISSLNA